MSEMKQTETRTANRPSAGATAERILDVAETGMRTGGYHAISYRDIAAAIGIKSASVHYHFPTKQDLGMAVVRRYKDRFIAALGASDAAGLDPRQKQDRLIALFRAALVEEDMICLCGLLGAEAPGLPGEVVTEVGAFFQYLIDWLTDVLEESGSRSERDDDGRARRRATMVISALEGAMILASGTDDRSKFEAVANLLSAED